MSTRIKKSDLEHVINQLNIKTNSPTEYSDKNAKEFKSNIGHHILAGAYGGYALERVVNEGGAVERISTGGYISKKELYNQITTILNVLPEVVPKDIPSTPKVNPKYKLYSKYKHAYDALGAALENYRDVYDLGTPNIPEVAREVRIFCKNTFDYLPCEMDRLVHFLQGLGLDIPYYNSDILSLAEKDGRLNLESATDGQCLKILNRYWHFMAMRLINISEV